LQEGNLTGLNSLHANSVCTVTGYQNLVPWSRTALGPMQ